MIAVIENVTGRIVRVTPDIEGIDLTGMTTAPCPEGFDPVSMSHVYVDGRWADNLTAMKARAAQNIKAEAGRRIEAFAPLWKQINDLNDPGAPGAAERASAIAAIRAYSNDAEMIVLTSTSAADLAESMAAIAANWPEQGV